MREEHLPFYSSFFRSYIKVLQKSPIMFDSVVININN